MFRVCAMFVLLVLGAQVFSYFLRHPYCGMAPWRTLMCLTGKCIQAICLAQRSILRLSLGKLLVNHLQEVRRTNTPLIPNKCRRRKTMFFLRRGFESHIYHKKLFQNFPMSNLKYIFPYMSPGNETAQILAGSPCISDRPSIPPRFFWGRVL